MSGQSCLRIQPFRCWQYRKEDETPVPRWIASRLMDLQGDTPKFYDGASNEWKLDEGDWIVEFIAGEDGEFGVYSDEQFRRQYKVQST